jgi:hypothetical protein
MEREPQPAREKLIDVLAILQSDAVTATIDETDNFLRYGRLDDQSFQRAIENVNAAIGTKYLQQYATITGQVYTYEFDKIDESEMKFVLNKELVFDGAHVHSDETGILHVVLEFFEEVETSHQLSEPDVVSYFITPDSLLHFEVSIEEEVHDKIMRAADAYSEKLLARPFLNGNHAYQGEVLMDALRTFDEVFEIGALYDVIPSYYFRLYDLALDTQILWKFDMSVLPKNEHFEFRGIYQGSAIPELMDNSTRLFSSKRDFELSNGTPSIILFDTSNECTYVIPTDAILSIDKTNH